MNLEELEEHELDRILKQYRRLAEQARENLRHGKPDTDIPPLPGE